MNLPPRPSSVNITRAPLSPSTTRKPPPPPSTHQIKLKALIEQKTKEKIEIEERLEVTKILKMEAAEVSIVFPYS